MGFEFRVCSLVRFQTKGIKVPQMVFSVVSFAMWTFIVYLFMKKVFFNEFFRKIHFRKMPSKMII